VIREVRRQEDGNDAKRGYAVGDAQRHGRRIGVGSGVSLRQNAVSAVIELDGRLACRAGRSGVAEYGPAHGDQVKGTPSDICTTPSRPTLMCRPEKVWTAPIPGGACHRAWSCAGSHARPWLERSRVYRRLRDRR
jgi:hypothetical protein